MTYKKRAQRGWCAGKGYKEESNRKERQYAKKEIIDSIPVVLGKEMGYTYGGSCGTLYSVPSFKEKKSGGYWDDSDFISVWRYVERY